MAKLTITGGPAQGQTAELTGECVIGREGTDLVIKDTKLSRRHVVLRLVDEGIEVEDLSSLNGTFVDGKRISRVTFTSAVTLKLGDTLIKLEPQSDRTILSDAIAEPDVTVMRDRSAELAQGQAAPPGGPPAGLPPGGPPPGFPPGGPPPGFPPGGPPAGFPPGGPPPGFPPGGPPPGHDIPPIGRLIMRSPVGRILLPRLMRMPPEKRARVVKLIPLVLLASVILIIVVLVLVLS